MPLFLGIDTSNYTTSVALYDSDNRKDYSARKLLPVKAGEKGIRQSDAVFHHTQQLPDLVEEIKKYIDKPIMERADIADNEKEIQKQRKAFLAGLMAMQANFELSHPKKEKQT